MHQYDENYLLKKFNSNSFENRRVFISILRIILYTTCKLIEKLQAFILFILVIKSSLEFVQNTYTVGSTLSHF